MITTRIAAFLCIAFATTYSLAADRLVFEPPAGTANGHHIVLISGDEEYRTEESCPMLGKILSQRHGFKCTVLFAIDKKTGVINPNDNSNIPGLETLADADLMIIGTRWRVLPDDQMAPILDYLNAGKPLIGFRTSTHAFKSGKFGGYNWANFGINVIGENWHSHHGHHKVQGGRAVVVPENADHPILNSVSDIYTASDIYGVVHLDQKAATVLLRGAVIAALDPDAPIVEGPINDPMMPLAWLKSYPSPSGETEGKVFATTAGAAVDLLSEDLRRLFVNASYFLTDQEVPEKADVGFVDPFDPSFYGFQPENYFLERGLKPEDFELGKSAKSVQ
ncbi:ThuA domain-containing protein [Novipirellula sp.]|uniref:ThuA domain-containing protein n=1 Tax=Novipirellula sp. TaxID=2795430 RepID=UPI0035662917